MSSIIFSIASIIVFFVDREINYDNYKLLFDSPFSGKFIFIFIMTISLLYWIYELIKNRKEELIMPRKENFLFLFLLVGQAELNMLIILYCSLLKGIKFENKIDISIKYIILIIFLVVLSVHSMFAIQALYGLYFLTFILFFMESITEVEHYILILLTAILEYLGYFSQWNTLIISMIVIASHFRYKLTSLDKMKLTNLLNKIGRGKIVESFIYSKNGRHLCLNYMADNLKPIQDKKKAYNSPSSVSDYDLSLMIKLSCTTITIAFCLGALWLQ